MSEARPDCMDCGLPVNDWAATDEAWTLVMGPFDSPDALWNAGEICPSCFMARADNLEPPVRLHIDTWYCPSCDEAGESVGGRQARDALLATVDALAALVDWPKLLKAGERAGKLHSERMRYWDDQDRWYRMTGPAQSWRLTEPS